MLSVGNEGPDVSRTVQLGPGELDIAGAGEPGCTSRALRARWALVPPRCPEDLVGLAVHAGSAVPRSIFLIEWLTICLELTLFAGSIDDAATAVPLSATRRATIATTIDGESLFIGSFLSEHPVLHGHGCVPPYDRPLTRRSRGNAVGNQRNCGGCRARRRPPVFGRVSFGVRPCDACGREFEASRGSRARFCSPWCQRRARARKDRVLYANPRHRGDRRRRRWRWLRAGCAALEVRRAGGRSSSTAGLSVV